MNLITPSDWLVRVFYSNIHHISETGHFLVFIRGKYIMITLDMFSNTLLFPRIVNLVFTYIAETRPPLDTMTSFLAKRTLSFDGK